MNVFFEILSVIIGVTIVTISGCLFVLAVYGLIKFITSIFIFVFLSNITKGKHTYDFNSVPPPAPLNVFISLTSGGITYWILYIFLKWLFTP